MSGHNKWSTIKRKKGALDSKRSKIFSKIIKEISIAVKEGGNDPDGNPRLRLAINNAKGVNMPKENITRAISKADSDTSNFQEVTFEAYGPGGLAVFVECLTDNNLRTVSNVRSIITKRNGSLGTTGCLSFLFERKGIFTVAKNSKLNRDEFELEVIDAGADEFEETDEHYIITTPMEYFGAMQKKLEELKVEAENAELQRIPNLRKTVDVDVAKSFLKLVDAIEEDDDVQNVFHNLEMTEELENALN